MNTPAPDKAAILAVLAVLFTPDDVIELRAFPKGRKRTDAGYFDAEHWPQLAEHAERLSTSGAAVYVTLNPVDPQLLSRYSNRIEAYAQSTTTDKQVTRRRWLLIDLDPVRPSGTSATDAQLTAAKAKARAVYKHLSGIGWPAPVVAESGNGYHLLFSIDLPNDDAAASLLKSVLAALAGQFDDQQTKVDQSVFNAARIVKLYGTVANKGDHTAMAPWRLSKLVQTPARAAVTPEQLRALIPAATISVAPAAPVRQPGHFSLEDFLTRHGLSYTCDRHDGSERFKLAVCPFNAEHVNGEAAIFRKASGALGFKCQHDSCKGKDWRDVRDLVGGPRAASAPEIDFSGLRGGKPQRGQTVQPSGATATDPDEVDGHRNAPKPSPDCLYGLIGDVAMAGSEATEANPYAIAANIIAFMGCAVGRGAFMPVGNTWHHPRQYMMHVGRSARGRKGDAVAIIRRIERALKDLNPHAVPQVHNGGLSSREGLVFLIHDGYKEGKNEVDPIHDKRLLVIESEFANVLHQSKREGNTLSAALRDCWDGMPLKPATKSNRLSATDPHLGMICAVTPSELLSLMASRELTNGFANRFMIFWAERTKMVAFPKATPQEVVNELARRVLEVLEFCRAERWAEKDHMRVELSPDARKQYEQLYRGELNDTSAGERITALIERRAPMLLRLAMLFALCDKTTTVQVQHVQAALAWVRYSVESVKFIFASAADELEVARTNDAAQKIQDYLAAHGSATRSELSKGCFQGHMSKSRIDAALDELLTATPPAITVESQPRPKGSPGAGTKVYRLMEPNGAKSAECVQSQGLAGDYAVCEISEESEMWEIEPARVRTIRTFRNDEEPAEIRAGIDVSLSSLNSQGGADRPPATTVGRVYR